MKRKPVQEANRKPDSLKKSEIPEELIQKQQKRERSLYPLRINRQTVIFVTRDKCNESYRNAYIERQKLRDNDLQHQHTKAVGMAVKQRKAKAISNI